MISDELKEIIDQIKDQGRMRFLETATEEQIVQSDNIQFLIRDEHLEAHRTRF